MKFDCRSLHSTTANKIELFILTGLVRIGSSFLSLYRIFIFIVDNYINADRHPKCDICDVYAHADLYGLGKGIFPKDKFPKLPAHPHCLCRIKPIVDGMINMSKQKDNVDKGGKAYINTLPKREQERLLGVHVKKM